MNFPILLKSKTFWTGITAVIAALAGFFTGELSLIQFITAEFIALQSIFVRDAISKIGGANQ